MSEIRTKHLDEQVKIDLCRLSHEDQMGESDILELLPKGLSSAEVDAIGFQVLNLTESVSPSRDGYSKGRKTETDVVRTIGFAAAVAGDLVTARSASIHLGKNKLSTMNWIARGVIYLQIRKHDKSDTNSLQTS